MHMKTFSSSQSSLCPSRCLFWCLATSSIPCGPVFDSSSQLGFSLVFHLFLTIFTTTLSLFSPSSFFCLWQFQLSSVPLYYVIRPNQLSCMFFSFSVIGSLFFSSHCFLFYRILLFQQFMSCFTYNRLGAIIVILVFDVISLFPRIVLKWRDMC